MVFSLFSQTKEDNSIVFVVESGIVSAARVLSGTGHVPRIVFMTRVPFVMSKKLSSDELIKSLNNALEELCKKIFVPGVKISTIHVVFSDPWSISHTKEIHIENEKIFVITRDFINNILEVEENEFKKESIEAYTERFGADVRVLEKNIFQARVNGYAMDSYVGKKTQTFDISTHISICSEHVLQTVVGCIETHTHIPLTHISFHTFPFVSFSVLNQLYPNQDFVCMDVSAEATILSLVHNNMLVQTTSFPSGTRFMTRQIETMLNVSNEIALSMLQLVLLGKANDVVTEQIETAVMTAEKEWAIYLEDALKTLHADIVLPPKLFLTASDGMEQVYSKFIKTDHIDMTRPYRKEVQVTILSDSVLGTLHEHVAHEYCDSRMALSVVFLK